MERREPEERELRVVIVDGDDEVVEVLAREVKDTAGVRLDGVFRDAGVLDEGEESAPDVVFLDPLIGPEDPEALLGRVAEDEWPLLVLVTGRRDLAVGAFERRVVDFILKPPTPDRVRMALERACREALLRPGRRELVVGTLSWEPSPSNGNGPPDAPENGGTPFPGRLMVKEEGRAFFIELDEIRYIRSDGNYVRIHAGDSYHLARGTMKKVESLLDPSRFIRIHRSTIVNVEWVREFQSDRKGRYSVFLKDGTELILSRSYRDQVLGKAL